MKKRGPQAGSSPSKLIDARIEELGDWRGQMLSRLRAVIREADPEVVEEWTLVRAAVTLNKSGVHG